MVEIIPDQELDRWNDVRAFAMEVTRKAQEEFLNDILHHIEYEYPIGYYFDLVKCELTIYAKYPGRIIGPYGTHVKHIEEKLNELYPISNKLWHVKFVEVRGGFYKARKEDNDSN